MELHITTPTAIGLLLTLTIGLRFLIGLGKDNAHRIPKPKIGGRRGRFQQYED